VAVSGVALAELAQGEEANGRFGPLRFAAAGLTLCPVVAVLGAKRPQDRAWHWVVFSLWMVVCIPAVNSAFFHPGGGVELHAAQGGFVTALVLLGIANYLPTRHAPFAMLTGLSQLLLFSEQLSFSLVSSPLLLEEGVVIYAVAVAVSPFARRARPSGESLDAAWLNFRDRFGSFWALRVLTRFNAAADANHWPARIGWSGFRPRAAETAAEKTASTIPAVRRCFHSLLRRFV
jgi:hypothetical protein